LNYIGRFRLTLSTFSSNVLGDIMLPTSTFRF